MLVKRNSLTYLTLAITIMILGLSVRHFSTYLPKWINLYLGDILWATMIFFLLGLIIKNKETKYVAAIAVLFTFSIEISQLYHSQWIDTLRQTRIGGLVLGYGFLWSDLFSYTIGIGIGALVEKFIILDSHIYKKF
ncbi:hypothetical protein DUF2809 [Gottschalkia acidurici 9a]|uniref:DUF2809 domain-containing protein n=1 Tax=Gottschalkia acidurici (strain ATCC 7906 / DSM 604 / BCRC 14475 / CIP 104303 / KCTC 5404 / NCIMB 10678 / 9a) TaxID=1128398 RepID=K0AZ22_GOTA9|nr:DUF2809 domain-containing protein [Gottschalkia acidurici]AFS79048.1 hypothetical protein DUF2809 [Gottschalkia acidurici 9a]